MKGFDLERQYDLLRKYSADSKLPFARTKRDESLEDRKYRPRAEEYMPYPEIVEPQEDVEDARGKAYDIHDSDGSGKEERFIGLTSKVERKMVTPLFDEGTCVGRHEMGHVAWSPRAIPDVPYDQLILQAVEDARINLGLAAVGTPMILDGEVLRGQQYAAVTFEVENAWWTGALLRAIASIGVEQPLTVLSDEKWMSKFEPDVAELIKSRTAIVERRMKRAMERATKEGRGPCAPFSLTERLAADLAKLFGSKGEETRKVPHKSAGVFPGVGDLRDRRRRAERQAKYKFGDGMEGLGRATPMMFAALVESGVMTIERPPLTVLNRGHRRGKEGKYRPRVDGSQLGRLSRLYIDGAIFRRKMRRVGGSVLIDCSGSMRLALGQVERMLVAAKGSGLVGIYGGYGTKGVLRIVGDKKRRVRDDLLTSPGGGNVIDLPALRWLGHRPEPRLWVSDGGVSGKHDQSCESITKACAQVQREFRITRIRNATKAVELLRKLNPGS